MEHQFSEREQIVQTCNRLYYHTDHRDWSSLLDLVFDEEVHFDMTSLGAAEAVMMEAKKICDMWEEGFAGLDAIHHQGGNYIVTLEGEKAHVKAYAIATHFREAATAGKTRTFVGSYDLGLQKKENGWRINAFKYNLKYMDGNIDLV